MYKIFFAIISTFFFLRCQTQNSAIDNDNFDDLTIVVSSCDKYSDLWKPFFELLFMQWKGLKESKIPIILLTNTKDFNDPRITVIKNPNEINWSHSMKKALKTIKTKYVLYLQEDYFLTYLDSDQLQKLFQCMKASNIGYMQLYGPTLEKRSPHNCHKNIFIKNRFEHWRNSLQAAFWERELFIRLIHPNESIWYFETEGTKRTQGCKEPFTTVQEIKPIIYYNIVQEGYLNASNKMAVEKKFGITFDSNLPKDSDFHFRRWVRKKIIIPLYWDVYWPFKIIIKNLMGKI